MLADPPCPACDRHAWATVGHATFSRDEIPATPYRRLRHRVLFELWAPEIDRFDARFLLCEGCGFVAYAPRPTAAEIDAKYRLIASESSAGTEDATSEPPRASALDLERSRALYAALRPHLSASGGTLLDFGGGAGGLLTSFAAAGYECGVIDYTPATVDGVRRLGDTLDDLAPDARFDLVLCSHVFEHVAEPVAIARRLADLLGDDGRLFVEVPLEILGGPPAMREPVTHVNFFCETSLATTLVRAGLVVVECHTTACLFASGEYRYGVRAIARRRRADDVDEPALPTAALARRLLASRPLARAAMAIAQPRMLLNPLRAVTRRLHVH